jgi:hypothetical protein
MYFICLRFSRRICPPRDCHKVLLAPGKPGGKTGQPVTVIQSG